MELNLLIPYNYSTDDLNIYRFETIGSVSYIAYFIEMPGFQSSHMYSFNFDRHGDKVAYDP